MKNKGFIQIVIIGIIAGAILVGGALKLIDWELSQQSEKLGAAFPYPVAGGRYKLSGAGIGASDTSIILQSFETPDGREIAMSSFIGGTGYATLGPGTSKKEFVSFTGISQDGTSDKATLTGVSRGLDFIHPYTASSTLAKSHSGGSTLILSNAPQLYFDIKQYVDNVATSGAATAYYDTEGLVELATIAELLSGTSTGSTGAYLVAQGGFYNQTSSATNLVPVTDASGKMSQGFLDLTTDWTFSGTTTIDSGDITIATSTSGDTFNLIPSGTVFSYAASSTPDGWLACDGTAYSTTTYANLFSIIGFAYGSATGSSYFLVPDLGGRQITGYGTSTASMDTMGETGGEIEHTQTIAEMPAHTHEVSTSDAAGNAGSKTGPVTDGGATGSTGGGNAFNVMDPFIVLNYIIKY